MTLQLLSESPTPHANSLADRFWSTVPGPAGEPTPVGIVSHLLAVIARFRMVQRAAEGEATMAGLSLVTLLDQHQEQGDVRYACPEQLAGEPLTPRSEVFTVAVLLFERLCDRHPFGMGAIQIARMRRGELGSSVNFFPRLPPLLRAILTRALSTEAELRYGDVDELAAALEMYVADARLKPELPGAPLQALSTQHAAPVDAVQRRPVSAWDRLRTDAEKDEIAAPDIGEQMEVTAPVDEQSRRRRLALPHAYRQFMEISDRAEPVVIEDVEVPELEDAEPPAGGLFEDREDDWAVWNEHPSDQIPTPPRRRLATASESKSAPHSARGRLRSALPFVLGAAAATVLFVVVSVAGSGGGSDGTVSKPVTTAERPPSQPQPQPAAAPLVAMVPPEPLVHSLAPDRFDPEEIASAALGEALPCFADIELEREMGFGLGILFEPGDLGAHQVYFPSIPELTPQRQACVDEAVLEVTAAAPPEKATAIELRMTLAPTGSAVEVKRIRK